MNNINFKILKGQKIGFVGITGSGKTTLLDIIMGLLPPNKGSLNIDGIKINNNNRRSWQSKIAHVPQSIFLSDNSIEENVAFGKNNNDIDHDRVKLVCKKAKISSAIESWPERYKTLVGERGMRISGGQRQRIGIARALYKKAEVIILDEATSALDDKTESVVMKEIEKATENTTLLIIAHRLSTLRNCDIIFNLQNGKIKKLGSYEDLIKLNNISFKRSDKH